MCNYADSKSWIAWKCVCRIFWLVGVYVFENCNFEFTNFIILKLLHLFPNNVPMKGSSGVENRFFTTWETTFGPSTRTDSGRIAGEPGGTIDFHGSRVTNSYRENTENPYWVSPYEFVRREHRESILSLALRIRKARTPRLHTESRLTSSSGENTENPYWVSPYRIHTESRLTNS